MAKLRAVKVQPLQHYEVEDAARTIARAEEHKRNPKMMKAIQAHVKRLGMAVNGGKGPKK